MDRPRPTGASVRCRTTAHPASHGKASGARVLRRLRRLSRYRVRAIRTLRWAARRCRRRLASTAARAPRQDASPQRQGAGDELFFAVNLSGHSAALQRQREVSFKDGEAVLLSGANGGFSVIRPTPARFVGLRMSQKQLAPLARGLDNSRMRVIPANAAPLRLLASYVDAIADMAEPISAEMSGVIAAHLHDLVALSVGPTQDAVAAARAAYARRDCRRSREISLPACWKSRI